jgi:hypothetical protein
LGGKWKREDEGLGREGKETDGTRLFFFSFSANTDFGDFEYSVRFYRAITSLR